MGRTKSKKHGVKWTQGRTSQAASDKCWKSFLISIWFFCIDRWRHVEFQSLDDQLKLKLHLAQLISTYLDVILWFLNAGLLPEQSEVNQQNPQKRDLEI